MSFWKNLFRPKRKVVKTPKRYEVFKSAYRDVGTKEWPQGHNPKVLSYFEDSQNSWVKDDETPWCAAFVGAHLERQGIRSTRKLNARSYESFGSKVPLHQAKQGDIVVFWRGKPDGWQGHVGFFAGQARDGSIQVLGGNQGDSVSIAGYPLKRLLSVRRY